MLQRLNWHSPEDKRNHVRLMFKTANENVAITKKKG
jgi:hypothetical protein